MSNEVTVSAPQRLKALLANPTMSEQFKSVLKDNSESFTASLLELYTSDSYLQNCNPKDVALEALKLASLKLPISKSLGFAYIIPFKGKPQAQIGYKGFIQLAIRSGLYQIISADYVHEGELISIDKVSGVIKLETEGNYDNAPIVGFFAYIKLINGFEKAMYWTVEQVRTHAQKYSQGYQSNTSIWKKNFNEMAKKTVLKNLLSHWGILSIEMIQAIEKDNESVSFQDQADMESGSIDISQHVNVETGEITDAETVPAPTEEPSF
jgi:recombination protein RecT